MTSTPPDMPNTPHAPDHAAPTVLIARQPSRARHLADLLQRAGMTPLIAPLTQIVPPADPEPLHRAVAALCHGEYPWVAVTSVNAVHALLAGIPPEGISPARDAERHWAAVGPATAHALALGGIVADVIPQVHTGAGLVAELNRYSPAHILLPLGDLAGPAVADGLRTARWHVDAVTAYRTVPAPVPEHIRQAWDTGRIAAVVVTSGSIARQIAAQLGPRADVVAVAIGEPSARVAQDVGLQVGAVAATATDPALAEAVCRALDLEDGRPFAHTKSSDTIGP